MAAYQALQVAANEINLPVDATALSADSQQRADREWNFFLTNAGPTAVTDASITVNSGYTPSLFSWDGAVVSGFPATKTTATIDAGAQWDPHALRSTIPVDVATGYDSTRTVSPAVIPPGGGQQTVTVTITPRDPRYQGHDGPWAWFNVIVDTGVAGVTLAGITDPPNTTPEEQLQSPTSDRHGLYQWRLSPSTLGKTYTFTATLNVPNPSSAPLAYRPEVGIRGERHELRCQACTSTTMAEPTLDGTTAGSGSVTYQIANTDQTWRMIHGDAYDVKYRGTDVQPVAIVVKPGTPRPAKVNLRAADVGVAVLSTGTFDARTLDAGTVRLGPSGTETEPRHHHAEDINHDGHPDLVLTFSMPDAHITCDTSWLTLTGQTTSGQQVSGTEQVHVLGCPDNKPQPCRDRLGCVTVPPGQPVTIATLFGRSGEPWGLGTDNERGTDLAVAHAGGSILGHPVTLLHDDGGCDPAVATASTQQILDNQQVVATVGPTCSGVAYTVAPEFAQHSMPLISPSATSPGLTDQATHASTFLRTAYNDAGHPGELARFVSKTLRVNKVAVIDESDWLNLPFVDAFTTAHVKVVLHQSVPADTSDFTALLRSVASARPGFVVFSVRHPADFVRQFRSTPGLGGVALGTWTEGLGVTTAGLPLNAQAEGVYAVTPDTGLYFQQPFRFPGADYPAVLQAYQARWGQPTSAFHGHAYDATNLVLAAVTRTARVDHGTLQIGRQALLDALHRTANRPGLIGKITCSDTGDCNPNSFVINQVRQGKWTPLPR